MGGNTSACRPTLAGPFCALCDRNGTGDVYYVEAAQGKAARCEPCGNTLSTTIALMVGAAVLALTGTVLLVRCCLPRLRNINKLAWHAERNFSVINKLTICVGFYMIATRVQSV